MWEFHTLLLFLIGKGVLITMLWFLPTQLFFSAQRLIISPSGSGPQVALVLSLVTCSCLHWTVEVLLDLHSTHQDSSQCSYQGRSLGSLWPSRLHVSPHFTPIVRSFTFQFLHKGNFAMKFTSCSVFPFTERNLLCWVFLKIHANWIHICVIFSSLLIVMCCLLKVSGQYVLLA